MIEERESAIEHQEPARRRGARQPQLRVGAVVALAAAAGFLVWLFAIRDTGGSSSSPVPTRARALPLSIGGLKTLAGAVGQPIYWVGRLPGRKLELTRTADGRVFIRYLPKRAPIGTDTAYLTVGTYPLANAYAVTQRVARRSSSVKVPAGSGAVAFYGSKTPTNVYVAFRGSNYQVEVYDPSAARAQQLVLSRKVAPVVGTAATVPGTNGAEAVQPGALRSLAGQLGHPVYWAGPKAGVTYELTHLANGRVFVRYLPKGVAVGANEPYLTVGTYPLADALTVTKKLVGVPGEQTIDIGGGAVAVYSQRQPKNIYIAYPAADLQVEVFDPSPGRARQLVATKRIVPVG